MNEKRKLLEIRKADIMKEGMEGNKEGKKITYKGIIEDIMPGRKEERKEGSESCLKNSVRKTF